jgi:hypothetical protein
MPEAALVLDLHLSRHQHCADFQIRSRRLAPNPLEHLWPMLLPVLRRIEQKALIERSARGFRRAARVSFDRFGGKLVGVAHDDDAAGRIMARLAPSRPVWLFRRGVIVRLARRELAWINVTAYPTAEWCCGHAPITS